MESPRPLSRFRLSHSAAAISSRSDGGKAIAVDKIDVAFLLIFKTIVGNEASSRRRRHFLGSVPGMILHSQVPRDLSFRNVAVAETLGVSESKSMSRSISMLSFSYTFKKSEGFCEDFVEQV